MRKTKKNYKVVFCRYSGIEENLSDYTIYLNPSDKEGKDFNTKTNFEYRIYKDKKVFASELKLGFIFDDKKHLEYVDDENAHRVAEQTLMKNKSNFVKYELLPQFFTMQFELQNYRQLIETFGNNEAQKILFALNDMALLNEIKSTPKWFTEALNSHYFNRSLVRKSEAYYAFSEAGKIILYGVDHENLQSKLNSFTMEFKLHSFSNKHQIDFDFSSHQTLDNCPITVLIGKNGLGKSQTLKNIVKGIGGGDKDILIESSDKNRLLVNRVLAIDNAGTGNATFPAKISKAKNIDYRKFTTGNKSRSEKESLTANILDLMRSPKSIGKNKRKNLFFTAIDKVIPLKHIGLPLKKVTQDDVERRPWISIETFESQSEQIQLDLFQAFDKEAAISIYKNEQAFPLSSGQLRFVQLAAWLCLNIENGSLVLLDEPDIFLHPTYISQLVDLLYTILDLTGARAVIATHSVYLVREVPQNQVLVYFENEREEVSVVNPRLKTLGADLGALTFFVFEEELFGVHIEKARGQLQLLSQQEKEQKISNLNEVLSTSAIMYLRRTAGLNK